MFKRILRPSLRPFLGRKLPKHLRARRVAESAELLPKGLEDARFLSLLEAIDGSSWHWGQEVSVFTNGHDALRAMRRGIAQAREEVLLESYIWHDDSTGRAIAEDLIEASRRGVTVKVLTDAFGSNQTRSSFWEGLGRHGIEVRLFNPLFSKLWNPSYRDHRKIMVVDRRLAFTGGMNIGEEYARLDAGAPEGSSPDFQADPQARNRQAVWRDTHLRVEGDAAWEMAVVFSEGWKQAGVSPLRLPSLQTTGDSLSPQGILVLDSQPYRGSRETAAVLSAIAGAARQRLWISNAYFAPLPFTLEIFRRAAERGIDVRLLVPGVTDVPLVRHAGHGSFGFLLRAGVRIFEYQPAVLHAKTLVADGLVSVVGSTNLDFRSFHYNAECNLVVFGTDCAQSLERAFERDLESAHEIEPERWHRRKLRHRLLDQTARLFGPLL